MDNCTSGNLTSTSGNVSFTSNSLNDSQANKSVASLDSSRLVTDLKLSLQVAIALFGIAGNILVFLIIRQLRNKKTTTDVYVQNLAMADLCVLLFSFPLAAIRERAPLAWPLGKFACQYLYPISDIFQGASVWCIAAIAIERYRKILTPRRRNPNRHRSSLKRAAIVSICVWVVSFLFFSLPLYFVVGYREFPDGGIWCGPVWPVWDHKLVLAQSYIGALTIFSYIVPLAVISWTYLVISRTIRRSGLFIKALKRESGGGNDNDRSALTTKNIRLSQNKRAKKILTPIVVVFAVTMLPLSILRITVVVWTGVATLKYYGHLFYFVIVFMMLNSSANPVIYSVASKSFRRRLTKFFWFRKAPQVQQGLELRVIKAT